MPESGQPMWMAIGESVDAGDLYLEENAAINCAQHCRDLVSKLEELKVRAYGLGEVHGFGTLPSGIALATKFSKKAVGGDYSLVDALTDHIAEVQAMQAVFEKIQARYDATERSNADLLRGIQGAS